jgi:antitoxin FitA
MEAEVREILRHALVERQADEALGSRIRQRFAAIGGAELELPARSDLPRSVEIV